MKGIPQRISAERSDSEGGFSMLEVVIAIVVIFSFLTATLQLMAINALYQVRAERQAQANFWIQEDLEDVKAIASTLNVASTPTSPYVSKDVCTNVNQGYATALKRQLTGMVSPNAIPTEQMVDTRFIIGKRYELYRTFPDTDTTQKTYPHRLKIQYRVQLASNQTANDYKTQSQATERIISNSYYEVIPDASFKCP